MRRILLGLLLALPGVALATPSAPVGKRQARTQQAAPERKAPSRAKAKQPARPRFPAVVLREPNLRETLLYRPFDDKGRPRKAAPKELASILRDYHTGRRHTVDARLGRALYEVARHYNKPLEIFSGYRPPAYSARAHSRHLTASAADFHVPGVPNTELVAYLRAHFHPAGVGYYPNGVHVHLDLDRQHDTYWVDAGEQAPSERPLPGAPEPDADEAPAVDPELADDEPAPSLPTRDPAVALPAAPIAPRAPSPASEPALGDPGL